MSYDTAVAKDLESAYTSISTSSKRVRRGQGEVSITAAGRSYTVDVVKMEQTNDSTGVVRKVRRLTSESEDVKGQFS